MVANRKRTQRPSSAIDELRVRMLHGDPLATLPDSDREWVMRSLLKGIRQTEVMQLARLNAEQYERALVTVRRWYGERCQAYKALPKVVRPVKAPQVKRMWPWQRPHTR